MLFSKALQMDFYRATVLRILLNVKASETSFERQEMVQDRKKGKTEEGKNKKSPHDLWLISDFIPFLFPHIGLKSIRLPNYLVAFIISHYAAPYMSLSLNVYVYVTLYPGASRVLLVDILYLLYPWSCHLVCITNFLALYMHCWIGIKIISGH